MSFEGMVRAADVWESRSRHLGQIADTPRTVPSEPKPLRAFDALRHLDFLRSFQQPFVFTAFLRRLMDLACWFGLGCRRKCRDGIVEMTARRSFSSGRHFRGKTPGTERHRNPPNTTNSRYEVRICSHRGRKTVGFAFRVIPLAPVLRSPTLACQDG